MTIAHHRFGPTVLGAAVKISPRILAAFATLSALLMSGLASKQTW